MKDTLETLKISRRDRFRGSMLGLATGDALGTTLEFSYPGSFDPIADIVGGGPFNMKPGEWTDDTSMMLCMAESLIECQGWDAVNCLDKFIEWYKNGRYSVKGYCFDIGSATRAALNRHLANCKPGGMISTVCGSISPGSAGNGSLMRLAPVALTFAYKLSECADRCADSSRTTHAARECVQACAYYGQLIAYAVYGRDKQTMKMMKFKSDTPRLQSVLDMEYLSKPGYTPKGTGYVVDTLEAALWAFHTTGNFRDGALKVVNLGQDADTTGAVYGQLAGAFYGINGIPAEWRAKIAMKDTILKFADSIYTLFRGREVAELDRIAESQRVRFLYDESQFGKEYGGEA